MSLNNKFILDWNEINFIKNYINYIYPIGFNENKKFNIDESNQIYTFIKINTNNFIKNYIYDNKIIDVKLYKKIINGLYII